MPAIIVNTLTSGVSGLTYKDLRLDLKINYTKNSQLLKRREIKDIQLSGDLDAIKNSLFNLFTTMPGQKILNPTYGLNLTQYLFVSVSDSQALLIRDTILNGVRRFEPRLTVDQVVVQADYDGNQYNIFLRLGVPALNIEGVSLRGALSESGYYFN